MAALLGLILAAHGAEPTSIDAFAPRALQYAGATPTRRTYRRVTERDGVIRGRSRTSRRPRYTLWELDGGRVVRLEERSRGRLVARRRFDPLGQPLTTERTARSGWPSVTVHLVPEREIGTSGWEDQSIPGGTMALPVGLIEHEDGTVGTWVLGGAFDVWHDPQSVDVMGEDFWKGLLAGCGCDLVDRVDAWVDTRPAVRFRVERGSDVQELWAVPLGERGTWLASFRAPDVSPSQTSLRLAPGRALLALVRLDRLQTLSRAEP